MLDQDQVFEVLVSSEDYLKIQARCNQLETLLEKAQSENKNLSLKLLESKEEITGHQKTISTLNENVKFLSQKSLNMAKTLMALENESSDLKISMVQNQKQLGIKYKAALTKQKELETKLSEMLQENARLLEELKQKCGKMEKILGVKKCAQQIQVSPKLLDTTTLTILTSIDIDQIRNKNEELQKKSNKFQTEVKKMEACVVEGKKSMQALREDLATCNLKLDIQTKMNTQLQIKLKLNSENEAKLVKEIKQNRMKLEESAKTQKNILEEKSKTADQFQKLQLEYETSSRRLEQMMKNLEILKQQKEKILIELAKKDNTIKGLKVSGEQLKQSLFECQKQIDNYHKRTAELQQTLRKSEAQKNKLAENIDKITQVQDQLSKNMKKLCEEINVLQVKFEESRETIVELQNNKKELQNKIEELSSEAESNKVQLALKQSQNQRLSTELLEIRLLYVDTSKKLEASAKQKDKVVQRMEIKQYEDKIKLEKSNEQLEQVLREFEVMNKEKIALTQANVDKERKVCQLFQQITALKEIFSKLRASQAQKATESTALNKKINDLEKLLANQTSTLQQVLNQNGMLQSSLSTVTARLELQQTAQRKNRQGYESLINQKARSQELLMQNEAQNKLLKVDLESTKEKLNKCEKNLSQKCQMLSKNKKETEELKFSLNQLQVVKSNLEQKNEKLVSQILASKQQNQQLMSRLKQAELQLEEERINSVKNVKSISEIISSSSTHTACLEQEINNLKKYQEEVSKSFEQRIKELENEVVELQTSKNEMQKEYEAVIEGYIAEKPSKSNSSEKKERKNGLKEIQKAIEDYFLEVGINLKEAKLEDQDINHIIGEQIEEIKKYAKQSASPFMSPSTKVMHSRSIS